MTAGIKDWVGAFRLRTLPLALSSIFMGNFLAKWKGLFDWQVFGLSVATTIFLQILSNLANDYGDSVHGADSKDRKGPTRAVQTGVISASQMKSAMYIFGFLSLLTGLSLLYMAFANQWIWILIFLLIGLGAIYAAIAYTAGKNPYGYKGLGDISVLIFFGLVGVYGSYFVQTQQVDWFVMLPAISCGLLATGVLNVNNIRDIDSDKQAGKISIPVRIGRKKAVVYHFTLLIAAIVCAILFHVFNFQSITSFLFILSVPLFVRNAWAVKSKQDPSQLDPYLKQLALSTLLFVMLFGASLLL